MSVTFKQLELFNAIIVAGSISRATRLVGLSQPTISQQLAKLEEELGTPLILRNRANRVELTPAGRYWFRVSEDMLRTMREVSAYHEGHFREDRLTLRLGVTPNLRGRFIAGAARLALEQKQFARFDVVYGLTSGEVLQQMQLHHINCAVVSEVAAADLGRSLHSVPLFRERLVWAVPSAIPHEAVVEALQTGHADRSFDALFRHVEVGTSVPWHALSESWFRSNLPLSTAYFGCNMPQAAVEFASSGLATCHLPLSVLPSLSAPVRASLRIYDLEEFERTIALVMPRHLMTLKPFAAFQEAMSDFAARDFATDMQGMDILSLPLPALRASQVRG